MKGYVIYLPKSKRSTKLAKATKKNALANIGADIELWTGVDRYEGWDKLTSLNLELKDFSRFGGGHADAEIATFFSHRSLWEKCIELNENILVLEHDAIFTNKVEEDFSNFKGDILNLGKPNWGSHKPADFSERGIGIVKRPKCKKEHDPYGYGLNETCTCDTIWLFGAHAYVVTPKGAKKLIKKSNKEGILPADVFISIDTVSIADYLPHSVIQDKNYSFVQKNAIYKNQRISKLAWDY